MKPHLPDVAAEQAEREEEVTAFRMCLLQQRCVLARLTCAGHGARVGLGPVEALLAAALLGLFLRRRAVRRTLGAVGVRGRRLVGARAARCRGERGGGRLKSKFVSQQK